MKAAKCVVCAIHVAMSAAVLLLCGCGSGLHGGENSPPRAPVIKTIGTYYQSNNSLDLPYAIAGQEGFTLLISGSGFTSSSVVQWNESSLATTFGGSTTDLAASVPKSLISTPGRVTVTVIDSGVTSNAVILPIASPAAASAGVVALVTVALDGSPANGDSLVRPSISATGRYVVFQSNATNLTSEPTARYQEIYERDTCISAPVGCQPSTFRITVTYDGTPPNDHSRDSSVSAGGRYVAFDSQATNLLPGTGICSSTCVFLRDTCVGASPGCTPSTSLISVASDGSPAGGANPAITPDGRFIFFNSNSANIVSGNTGGVGQAFVRDTCNGALLPCIPNTTLVSQPSSGDNDNGTTGLVAPSSSGRYSAFQSWATNIAPGVSVVPGYFWRDSCIGSSGSCSVFTSRVDVTANGEEPNSGIFSGTAPAISGDGRLVAFGSMATNLVPADVLGHTNVYLRDMCAGAAQGCIPSTSLVSVANDGSIANCGSPGNNGGVSISGNGRFVAFDSIATNLTPDDTFAACSWEDTFVRDTCIGAISSCVPSTVRVSVASSPNPGTSANAISSGSAISSDGHYVVFISAATNLAALPLNGHAMVYVAKTGF